MHRRAWLLLAGAIVAVAAVVVGIYTRHGAGRKQLPAPAPVITAPIAIEATRAPADAGVADAATP